MHAARRDRGRKYLRVRARERGCSRGNALKKHRVAEKKFSPAFFKRRRGVGAEPQLGLRRGRNACAYKKRRRGQRKPVPPGPGALRGTHAPGGVPRAGGFDILPPREKRCSAGSCFASAFRRAEGENPPAKNPARRSQPGKQSGGLFSRACGGHAARKVLPKQDPRRPRERKGLLPWGGLSGRVLQCRDFSRAKKKPFHTVGRP